MQHPIAQLSQPPATSLVPPYYPSYHPIPSMITTHAPPVPTYFGGGFVFHGTTLTRTPVPIPPSIPTGYVAIYMGMGAT